MAHVSGQFDEQQHHEDSLFTGKWGEAVDVDSEKIKANLEEIKTKIAPCKPRIIGVTKYYGRDSVIKGYEAGLRDFGESRALEAIEKIESLPQEIRKNSTFHFIGHLQTNKAAKVAEYFDFVQSVDSLKLASVLSKTAANLGKHLTVLLQVNTTGEEQKFGYSKEALIKELPDILKLDSINVAGLMNMASFGASAESLKNTFSSLRMLRDELEKSFQIELPELSMGMSDDYEIAVKEGATIIRIGRKLFK